MKPILECKGLSKKYNKSAYALHNLNLTLNHGQIIGLLGPNGSDRRDCSYRRRTSWCPQQEYRILSPRPQLSGRFHENPRSGFLLC